MKKILKKLLKEKSGFTMMEVIMVVVIFAVLAGLSILFYQSMQVRADLTSISSSFVELARVSQGDAASGKLGVNHGIHLETNKYVLFNGNVYDANSNTNFIVALPSSTNIQSINLNGGGSNIVFTQPKGETTNYGTFIFNSAQTGQTKTITITSIGTIDY